MIFKTKRCYIRKLTEDDLAGMYELQGNPNVMRFASGDVLDEAACKQDIEYLLSQYEEASPELLVWAVTDKEGTFIGTCALILRVKNQCEIGYRIVERFWGQGYATEIATGLVRYCQYMYPDHQLCAYCFTDNVASCKVLEKTGFQMKQEFFNESYGLQDRHYLYGT